MENIKELVSVPFKAISTVLEKVLDFAKVKVQMKTVKYNPVTQVFTADQIEVILGGEDEESPNNS